ncbi:MAG: hypothetical protein H0W18_06585 [Acidobacteria bacterium]|nr:hypothetical protein [Acidobacteriota bacterium]
MNSASHAIASDIDERSRQERFVTSVLPGTFHSAGATKATGLRGELAPYRHKTLPPLGIVK